MSIAFRLGRAGPAPALIPTTPPQPMLRNAAPPANQPSTLKARPVFDGEFNSHTPDLLKPNEQNTAYNPFFYDLNQSNLTLDPAWAKQPGIILNWLF